MNANERELILKEEVYAVVSCAMEVLNIRGHGLHEKIYENCLCVEFQLRGIPYTQQQRIGSCIKVRSWEKKRRGRTFLPPVNDREAASRDSVPFAFISGLASVTRSARRSNA